MVRRIVAKFTFLAQQSKKAAIFAAVATGINRERLAVGKNQVGFAGKIQFRHVDVSVHHVPAAGQVRLAAVNHSGDVALLSAVLIDVGVRPRSFCPLAIKCHGAVSSEGDSGGRCGFAGIGVPTVDGIAVACGAECCVEGSVGSIMRIE